MKPVSETVITKEKFKYMYHVPLTTSEIQNAISYIQTVKNKVHRLAKFRRLEGVATNNTLLMYIHLYIRMLTHTKDRIYES